MDPKAYQQMAEVEDAHWWYVARRNIFESIINGLNLKAGARILEVGCGTGGNLAFLRKLGTVSAIEMDETARRIAEGRGGEVEIRAGLLPDHNPFAEQKFDLIVLLDVLEHIEDDAATLQALRKCAAPDSKLLITVPAYSWMWSKHDDVLHHKRRYVKSQLTSRVRDAGFNVKRATYFNTILFPLVAAARVMEKFSAGKDVVGQNKPADGINGFLQKVFESEKLLLSTTNLPFGVSLLCVAEVGPQPSSL